MRPAPVDALAEGHAVLVTSVRLQQRARELCASSGWLVVHAAALRRRQLGLICGGADLPANGAVRPVDPSDDDIRRRIRRLLDTGRLPLEELTAAWAGVSPGGRPCSGCGGVLERGEAQYSVRAPAIGFLFHRRCFGLYTQEVLDGEAG